MPVRVDWWDEDDFRRRGLERLIPPPGTAPPGEKFRVVEIVGAEVYPCGGTHEQGRLAGQLHGELKTLPVRFGSQKGRDAVGFFPIPRSRDRPAKITGLVVLEWSRAQVSWPGGGLDVEPCVLPYQRPLA
ncbi:hypothetical protein VTK73DRAFT_2864 [Phialemonium thermophilum]|uniref:Uncharacterized protein n=1 Tax=Phialemonium thermophilum TaxID=223376 RepID=A0ABR3VQB1_9PEZI